MKTIFSYTKIFTCFLSILYIIGLVASFYNLQIILSIFVFLFLAILILFFNFDFKKSLILFLIFFLGILRANSSCNIDETLKNIDADDVTLSGQIISSKNISIKNQRIKFYLNVNKATINNGNKTITYDDLNSKAYVSVDLEENIEDKIIIGDYIEIQGKLRTPKPATNPHQFDYKRYLLNNNCANVFYGNNKTVKIISHPIFNLKNPKDSYYYLSKKCELTRIEILKKHSKNLPQTRLKVLGGLVFGDETINPDEKIKEDFKNSGLLHLLAASGLNVALIYGIWWWIASFCRLPYNFSILTGAFFVILYTFMTGFPPSIIRAGIMLLFVLFGKIIDREINSVALIFFAAFIMLLCNPKMLFDVGFQLSFVVTLGLIICCPVVISKFEKIEKNYKEKHKNKPKIIRYLLYFVSPVNLISVFLIPFVAQLWVIPLQMHYFNNFAPMSVCANVAVVPFIGILSFIGFISSIIALIPVINDYIVFIFDFIANPMLALLIKISELFASFKFSIISVFGLNFIQIFEFWGILLLITLNIKSNFQNKKHKIILGLTTIIFLLSFIKADMFSSDPQIIMFNVENADCFMIKTPKHKYIMIDTGRKIYRGLSNAETIMNKYLKNERINNLEYLIITHFDIDHSGGAEDILNNAKVKEVIIQSENSDSKTAKGLIEYLKSNKISYTVAKNNRVIYSEPDLKITIFKPEIMKKMPQSKLENETSIITLLNYKDKNILFMADSGIIGYEAIKQYLPEKIDIIKIGHHGAKNSISNNMLHKIHPNFALISSKENDRNHPHNSTLNTLYDNNVKILSSKDYGFIKISIKDNIAFYHYNKFKHKVENIIIPSQTDFFDESLYMKDFVKKNLK